MQRLVKLAVRPLLMLSLLGLLLPAAAPGAGWSDLKLDLHIIQKDEPPPPAIPSSGTMKLSLRDSIALALKYNLDTQVQGFNTAISDQALINQEAQFDPSAFLELSRADNRYPGLFYSNGRSTNSSDTWDFNTGVRQKILTGGTYELRFNNERYNSQGADGDYSSRFGLTLTQPLLKNFGFAANETNIRIAVNNRSISSEQLRLQVSSVVTQVQNAYFDLIFAIRNLEVQRQTLKLARDLVSLNQARVRAGVAAPVDVTQAEAQAAAGVQDVILAEKAVQDAEDTLKVIMNLPISGSWSQQIDPTTAPTEVVKSINLDESIQQALGNRYELKSAKLDIQNKELSTRLARNQLLPDLALTGSVFSNGAGSVYGSDIRTRLLTPREGARLMGDPDLSTAFGL